MVTYCTLFITFSCLFLYSAHIYILCLLSALCVARPPSQLPSLSPWSSKEGTVQTCSLSSVDTVIMSIPHNGYTIGQWRGVNSLALPSLVQCTLFKLEQNTPQPLMELILYELWMDLSSSVRMMYWEHPSRVIQSSTPLFLLVSLEIVHLLSWLRPTCRCHSLCK